MADEQTGTVLRVWLAVQDLWVSDNRVFFGLLKHCVRVGRSIWIKQRSCWDAERTLAAQTEAAVGVTPQDTAPEEPYPPAPASLVRPLALKELALGPVLGGAQHALPKPSPQEPAAWTETNSSKMKGFPLPTKLRERHVAFQNHVAFELTQAVPFGTGFEVPSWHHSSFPNSEAGVNLLLKPPWRYFASLLRGTSCNILVLVPNHLWDVLEGVQSPALSRPLSLAREGLIFSHKLQETHAPNHCCWPWNCLVPEDQEFQKIPISKLEFVPVA